MSVSFASLSSTDSASPEISESSTSETATTKPKYCFVLPWPFELFGGVNQVVRNLIVEFQKDKRHFFEPLALELSWPPKPDDVFDSRVNRIYTQLRSPYVANRRVSSALGFLLHLPGDLFRLRRLCRTQRIGVLNMHFVDLEAL